MLRDLRDHPRRLLIGATLVVSFGVTACGGSDPTTIEAPDASSTRPTTAATIAIVRPADGAVVDSPVSVEVEITAGRIVGPQGVAPSGGVGHVHLVLDGGVETQMLYGPTIDLGVLEPGPHTLQAEFVATDHRPFANRPNATVVFTVR